MSEEKKGAIDGLTGNLVNIKAKQAKWLSPSHLQLPNGQVATLDKNEIVVEIYNQMDEEIFFQSMRNQFEIIRIGPRDWGILPHSYYIASCRSGSPIRVTKNYGSMIGKGNKLPSRPEAKK